MAKTTQTVAQFLALGGSITKCPASMKQAPALSTLRREQDEAIEAQNREFADVEVQQREAYAEARACGFSVSEALDIIR